MQAIGLPLLELHNKSTQVERVNKKVQRLECLCTLFFGSNAL